MKKWKKLLIPAAVVCVILAAAIWALGSPASGFEEISHEKLRGLLEQRENSVIFCKQESCCGCDTVEKDLEKIAKADRLSIYSFEIETHSDGELLQQYGLDIVPAIIHISNGQVNVYKGALSEEHIRKALTPQYITYDRFDDIVDISYEDFQAKADSPSDFFVYFGNERCSDCINFTRVLKQHLQESTGAGMYYVDLGEMKETLSEDAYQSFLETYYINWIPSILHIKNGVKLSWHEYPDLDYRREADNSSINSAAAKAFLAWLDNELK